MQNKTIQKIRKIQAKNVKVSKLHAKMAQNLPEMGRLPNFGVEMNKKRKRKKKYKNTETSSEIGRDDISDISEPLIISWQVWISTLI